MKERFGICLESGDSVSALLPIPGSPLQVDKKVSDLNYVINTHGRRKQKQMCHISMLKRYIDRDSSADLKLKIKTNNLLI